jgi:predicted DNA-binding protein
VTRFEGIWTVLQYMYKGGGSPDEAYEVLVALGIDGAEVWYIATQAIEEIQHGRSHRSHH